ncbi:hypothetical protein CRG98_015588 [Punica granatum]|uniref:Reverse transcriptase RNase H-like domain-containing protein n=1 Tax=Punica granatum TaxID=22663 RepID=A0A2I0K8L8_PUNGR|nr:hypothetical protein CRG98_015588 [Punica granatum]
MTAVIGKAFDIDSKDFLSLLRMKSYDEGNPLSVLASAYRTPCSVNTRQFLGLFPLRLSPGPLCLNKDDRSLPSSDAESLRLRKQSRPLGTMHANLASSLQERLCKYVCGSFSKTEQNYTTHERELLAVIKTLKKWRVELLPRKFILRTDSSYVTRFRHLKGFKQGYNQGRLIRWQLELEPYTFVEQHALDDVVATKMATIEALMKEVESIQLQKEQLAKVLGIEVEKKSLPAETLKESTKENIQESIPEYIQQSANQRRKEVGEQGTSSFIPKESPVQPKKRWADQSDDESEVTESKLSVTRKESVEESKLSSTRFDESVAGSKLPATSTAVSVETVLPDESLWQHAKAKKFYVIFNGCVVQSTLGYRSQ